MNRGRRAVTGAGLGRRGVGRTQRATRCVEQHRSHRAETHPHVVLMDLAMPGKGGIEATRRIVALGFGTKVLVLTALPQELQLSDALEAGASGFMRKIAPVEELTRAIRVVADDRLFLDEDAARLMVLHRYSKAGQADDEKVTAERLSAREREVLALLALGHSSRAMGQKLR